MSKKYAVLQLLVHRDGCEDNRRLASLGPGSLIEVSEVMGRGCAPRLTQLFSCPAPAYSIATISPLSHQPSCLSRSPHLRCIDGIICSDLTAH